MKKIGILFGQEKTFPQAFIDRINSKKVRGIHAEFAHVDEVVQATATDYAVIIDRISQDVPFYRTYLKNAATTGTAVINNPFWWSADDKCFNNVLAEKIKIPVPKTVLLPSKDMPQDTDPNSFRNLKYPLDWEKMVNYLGGFPLYMKPYAGGGWKSVYKLHNYDELFSAYTETGELVMMLQENIDFTTYFRCYCLGGKYVHIMPYEPRNPHHERYIMDKKSYDTALLKKIKKMVIQLNEALGYDFNTVEFAVRDGIPYAIDFCNPAPDADLNSVGEENFEWVVENAAELAIERARAFKKGKMNLTWGSFVRKAILPA
jgi:glutathione synthase/RimK-type ligase-like ATP-grasp enzyme